jgi:hypothetical protein
MPRFDGTGPLGQGPMTGRGLGFCVLKESQSNPGQIEGFAGINGKPIKAVGKNRFPGKEVIDMPFGDRTGPAGMGPMTGRAAGFCAGFPAPGYMNPFGFSGFAAITGAPAVSPYALTPYGYGLPYAFIRPRYGRGFGLFGFGRGFGRGRGWGRGRGRFGFWW